MGQPFGQFFHMGVVLGGHHFREVRLEAGELQRVGRKRGAHAGMAGRAVGVRLFIAAGGFFRQPPDGSGQAACHAFADDEDVGRQGMNAGIAAVAGGDGVGFVDDEQRAIAARQGAQPVVEPGIGQDHARVGHDGFGQDGGNLAGGEGRLNSGEVVEFHASGQLAKVGDLTHQALPIGGLAVGEFHHRIVNRAVVAAVEHKDLGPPGDGAGDADGKAVGIGCRGGDLPAEGAEGVLQEAASLKRVFGRQHIGQAARRLMAHGARHRLGRMAEHRAGVAKAEIVDLIAVDIGDPRAFGACHKGQVRHRPVFHPVQGHAREIGRRALVQGRLGLGARGGIALGLAGGEAGQAVGVDACDPGHGRLSCGERVPSYAE